MMIPHSNPARQVAVELHLPGFAPVKAMATVATDEIFLQPVHPECRVIDAERLAKRVEKGDPALCSLLEKIFPGATDYTAEEHSQQLTGN